MNPRIENSFNRITDQARDRYAAWLKSARNQTEQVAGQVRKGKRPVKTLSQLGIRLTGLSHRTTTKVLKQQTRLVEHQIDALAGRIRSAAHAESVRELVRVQVQLIPENASQFVTDTRAALSIVADAGTEVREILGGTISELRGKAEAPAAPKAAPKAKKKKTVKTKAKTPVKAKTPAKAKTPVKAKTPAKAKARPVARPKAEPKPAPTAQTKEAAPKAA